MSKARECSLQATETAQWPCAPRSSYGGSPRPLISPLLVYSLTHASKLTGTPKEASDQGLLAPRISIGQMISVLLSPDQPLVLSRPPSAQAKQQTPRAQTMRKQKERRRRQSCGWQGTFVEIKSAAPMTHRLFQFEQGKWIELQQKLKTLINVLLHQ
ncbi:hypothetical protein P7K49_009038 [Saguinus oedipus]|uniref:Uncharacterized protein n=1 Tax=Saguinus oedipus TaxID=9490 RepID=A0ABQ9W316_SAGOE|nr:hypothetical protein P7K49_009038 [Saguinus oedipus]